MAKGTRELAAIVGVAAGRRSTRFMPQSGQVPGASCWICGCIGHTNIVRPSVGATAIGVAIAA